MRRWILAATAAATLATLGGCAENAREAARSAPSGGGGGGMPGGMSGRSVTAPAANKQVADYDEAAAAKPQSPGIGSDAAVKAQMPRRIIYTAEVDLVAEDLGPAQKDLLRLVKLHHGYIAENEVGGASGEPRFAKWKLRVPVDEYDGFMDAVGHLAEVQRVNATSQDVSEEFYDVQARLKNKKVEEQRLQDHLSHSTAKLTDILAVEKELSRVREEAERMEGRIRFLSNQTELTTVTVTVREVKNYKPERATTFGSQIGRTFGGSLEVMGALAKELLLAAVALAPWLAALALVCVPCWLYFRRRWKKRAEFAGL